MHAHSSPPRMRTSSQSRLFLALGALFFAASLVVVRVGHAEWRLFGLGADTANSGGPITPVQNERVIRQEEEIVQTVERVEPAVVSVIITKDLPKLEIDSRSIPFPGGRYEIQIPQYRENGTERREVGGGSAFFVSGDGLLMTNKHVVDDETAQYTVLLNDGRRLVAEVVGRDPLSDIALLKVDGSGFPYLTIAGTDDVNLGQTSIAIGNALGEFRNTVSVGVISGLQRSIIAGGLTGGGTEHLDEILQTDAAINEGNSGGPLLSSRGEVIGMSTAIAAGGAQNIGFALPARELRRVLESYQEHGRIVRVYLGVRYVQITPELQKEEDLSYDYGVQLTRGALASDAAVLPDSPADDAGLQEGDILLEADGQKLTEDTSLQRIISGKSVGDTLQLRVATGGREREVTVRLEEMEE